MGIPYRKILAVLMAVIAMLAVYVKMGIFFETNDDRLIAETLSGAIIQKPDAHLLLINYILSAPLAWLYQVAKGIPWYGGCLILFHVISYAVIFNSILTWCTKQYEFVLGIILCGVIFLINLYSIGLIQWTSTAALLAIAGYVVLISGFDDRAVLVYAGFQLLAVFLRTDAMLMIQLFGGAVFLGLYLSGGCWKNKADRKILLKWALAIAGVLLIGTTSRWIVYHSDEWKTAEAYNNARAALMDYYGVPAYEEVQDILDRYHVTRTEYEGFANGIMIGSNIDAECLQELMVYAMEINGRRTDWAAVLRESAERLVREESLESNRLAGILWICVLLWMIAAKSRTLILPVLGLGAARTVAWCYLIYRGRLPARVTYPLFLAEIVLILILIWKTNCVMGGKMCWHNVLILSICSIAAINAYGIGQRQYRYVSMVNREQAVYIQGYREIRDYCRLHPERRYILDSFSFSFYKGSALETSIYEPANGIYTGAWINQSPVIKAYEREYLGEIRDDFYVIVYDDGQPQDIQETNISVRYFTEKTGQTPIISDRLTVSHGGSYLIWYFGGEEID